MRPLQGTLVLDATRMLPGAVLARVLLELGARVIKVEYPAGGDPLRDAPPHVDGVGAGFRQFHAGAESLCLDLRDAGDAARLRKLVKHADVLTESFRPGSMESWGVGAERLAAANPRLVLCRLSGFGVHGRNASRVAHDLNVVARAGLLDLLPAPGVPRLQLADVTTGLLAAAAVLAALLGRVRTDRGAVIDQPLASGAIPFVTWALADLRAGGGGLTRADGLLAGVCAAYRIYACADGERLAVGALEPKFWTRLLQLLDLRGLEGAGLDTGDAGRDAARRVAERLASRPRAEWLELADAEGLPLSPVRSLERVTDDAALREAGLIDDAGCGPYLPSLGARPATPAPALGQHTAAIVTEFALDERGDAS